MTWKETLRSLPRRTWFRVLVGVVAFLLLVVLVCNLIVLLSASQMQTTREELASDGTRFDCILVPGARVHPDGKLYPVLQDRMDVGLSLLRDGYAETLLRRTRKRMTKSARWRSTRRRRALRKRKFYRIRSVFRLTKAFGGQNMCITPKAF